MLNEMYFPGTVAPLVRFSRKLLTRGGYWDPETGSVVLALELYREQGPDAIIDVTKHELIHHYLGETEELPHGSMFLAESERVGASLHCSRFAVDRRRSSNKRYTYACPTCRMHTTTKRRATLSCGHCSPGRYDAQFVMVLTQREVVK